MLIPGSRVGGYEVVDVIGTGGMGEVYRARDAKLNREVAIKILSDVLGGGTDPAAAAGSPQAGAADERLLRFEREARLLASLNHPNIAQIFAVEHSIAGPALVMELVDGATLEELVAQRPRPLPLDEALPIARQLADALDAAHERGIVHRDLKPANVKVTSDGTVKVLDFGLAKAVAGDGPGGGQEASASGASALTLTSPARTALGVILGTASYMSPEQARGRPVDKRADIWAFGVVLYEMLAGRRLFDGETVSDVIAAVLTREVDWSVLPATTPAPIRRLLARCLERDPRLRLRDIGDARFELAADTATVEPADAPTPSAGDENRPWSSARLLFVTALVAIALTSVGLSVWFVSTPAADPMVFPIPAPPGTRLEQVTVSPDGGSLAFVAESPAGVTELWIRELDSREARRVAGTEGARDLFWSPDSRSIGFFTEERLWKLEVGSGALVSLAATAQTRGGSWSRRNTIVVGGADLRRVQASGGGAEMELANDEASGENAIRFPWFLPDDTHVLVYSRNAEDHELAGLWAVELGTGVRKQLTSAASSSAVYVEPGVLLYRRDGYLIAHPFDTERLELTGDARVIAKDLWYEPGVTALSNISASTTGTVLFRTGGPEVSDLVWFDRRGQSLGTVWEPHSFITVGLSRDGTQVLTGFPSQGPERDVWLYDLPSGTARQIAAFGDLAGSTVFSDDGGRALLGLFAEATLGPWLVELTSGAKPEPLVVERADGHATDFHGEQVVYEGFAADQEQRGSSLNLLDLATGEDRVLVDEPGNESFGVVSPDGRWLAFSSDQTGDWEVYVATFPKASRRWRISVSGGYQPRWNPRGGELFYLSPDRRMMSVRLRAQTAELQWDAPQPLFQTAIVDLGPHRGSWVYAVAPDGERFLIVTRQPQSATPAVAMLNWR